MAALRRVLGERAGPSALGILVPPGRRTVVVLRPRALDWDLLLVPPSASNGAGSTFREVSREEGAATADDLYRALETWASGGPGRVEMASAGAEEGYWVRALVGPFTLVACLRVPGQPYEPMVFARADEAQRAADAIAAVLCPPPDAEQEVYFNSRNFSR